MIRLFVLKYNFTIENFVAVRSAISSKICYKPKLSFLKYRTNLTNSLSNRLVINSQYQRSYKDLREFYIKFMRANFSSNLNLKYRSYIFSTFENKKFLIMYTKTRLMRELDYALLWKAGQFNSLFNLAATKKKKKKIITYKQRVFFIPPKKRLLFVWKWLCIFIRSTAVKNTPRRLSLIKGLENFFFTADTSNVINNYKLQIYKLQLLRTV